MNESIYFNPGFQFPGAEIHRKHLYPFPLLHSYLHQKMKLEKLARPQIPHPLRTRDPPLHFHFYHIIDFQQFTWFTFLQSKPILLKNHLSTFNLKLFLNFPPNYRLISFPFQSIKDYISNIYIIQNITINLTYTLNRFFFPFCQTKIFL